VIHGALLVAVHAQPAPALTVTVPVAAAGDASVELNGEIEKLHGVPGCVIVNVLPAIVSEPVLAELPVFAATVYEMLPLPVPVAPAPMVIHELLLAAVQLHPALAVTTTLPLAPIDPLNVDDVGEIA
jgi:hypothetical protein